MLPNPHTLLPTSLLALLLTVPFLPPHSTTSPLPPSLSFNLNYGLGAAAMMTKMSLTPLKPTTTAAATISPNDPFRVVLLKSPRPPEPPMCCLKRSGSSLDLEEVEEGMLLSFEEWKARHEKDRAAELAGGVNGSAHSTAYANKSAFATSTMGSPSGNAAMGVAEAGVGRSSQSVSNENGDTSIPNVTGSGADAGSIPSSGDITSTPPTSSEDPINADNSHDYYQHQQELSPHFMVPLTDRFNYANLDCSARVHVSHKSAKSPSSILSSKRDRYMLSPCRAKGKDGRDEKQFVVVELCEDIRIDTVQLANFEFFSGVFKEFEVSVAKTYTTNPEDWTPAGTYKAKNVRGVQSFHPPTSLRDFYRYIRIDFRSYYGTEYYCPISLLRVYGLTHLEEWKWEMWEAGSRARKDEQAAQLAAAAAAASEAASYYYASQRHHPAPHSLPYEGGSHPAPGQMPTVVQGEKSPELPSPQNIVVTGEMPTGSIQSTGLNNSPAPSGTSSSSPTAGSDSSGIRLEGSHVLTDGIFVTVGPSHSSSSPTPIAADIPSSSSSSGVSMLSSSSHRGHHHHQHIHHQKDGNDNNESAVTSNLTNPPNAQVTAPQTTAATREDGSQPQAEGGNPMNSYDVTTSSTGSASSSFSSSGSSNSVASSQPGVTHDVVQVASSKSVMSAEGNKIPTYSRTPNMSVYQQRQQHGAGSSSSSSQSSQAASSSSSSPTASPIPPPPPPPASQSPPSYWATGGGESIYRTIMNRLSALETNHTLYVRYIEQQTNGVREVLKRLTEEVGRIEGIGRANSITQQRSAQEWDRQTYQIQREYRALKDRVEYLADEINLEKRLSIAQLCLLAAVLVFMGLTRGSRGSGGNGNNETLARQPSSQEQTRSQAAGRDTKGTKTLKGRGPRFLSFSGDWMSKSKTEPQVERKGKEKEKVAGFPAQEGVGDERVAFPTTDTDPSEERDDSETTPYLSSDDHTINNIAHPIPNQPHHHRSHRHQKSKSNGSSHSRSRTPSMRHAAMNSSGSGTATATSRHPHFQKPVTPTSTSSKPARLARSNSMHGAIYLSPGPIPPVGYGVYSPQPQYYYPLAHGQGHNYVIMGGGFSTGPGPRSVKKWAKTAHLHELRVTPGSGNAGARARVVASASAGSVGSRRNAKDEQHVGEEGGGDGDVFSDSPVLPASLSKKENRVMVLDTALSPQRGQRHHRHSHLQQRGKKNSHLPSPSPSQASVSVFSEDEGGEQGKKVQDVHWERTGNEEDGQWIDTDSNSEGDTESCPDADPDSDSGFGAPALFD